MEIGETLYLIDRNEWRKWLEKHHETKKEIWLIYYKKHTDKPRIPYDDAVEEALCFGWIDSIVKRIDDETYAQRYTPRNLKSVWSPYNIKRVKRMIQQGKMMDIGLKKYEYGIANNLQAPTIQDITMPEDFKNALSGEKKAESTFGALSKSKKIMYIHWITSAKGEETRKRRIKKTIELLNEDKKSDKT